MPFPQTIDVPDRLVTERFLLRPITAADAARDHAAVMASREQLRVWEQSSWPEDDFTVAANREDLEKLEQRHAAHQAFTYTVLDPTGTECLGCVYLMPPDARMYDGARITPIGDHRWADYAAMVYFWVRSPLLATGLDRLLLDELRDWLARDWDLGPALFVTNEQLEQQVKMIEETGLQLRFRIHEAGKPGRYLAYARR